MADNSAFSKKKLETIDIEKRDWMEELNIPPQIAKTLRENAKQIQIGAIALLVLFLAWNGLQYYWEQQKEKSTAALSQAIQTESDDARLGELQKVVNDFSGSDAALWAQLEVAHQSFEQEKYQEAVDNYKSVLQELGSKSSLTPLLYYSLAHAYEGLGDKDQALAQYEALSKQSGFEKEGFLGMGRVYESKGDTRAAISAYEKVVNQSEESGFSSDWIEQKLRQLKQAVAAKK